MGKSVIQIYEIKGMMLPVVYSVLGIATRQSGFDRGLLECEDFKGRLSRIRNETKKSSLISPTAPNGAIMSASLEVPRRNQDDASHPCPDSTLQKDGYLFTQ